MAVCNVVYTRSASAFRFSFDLLWENNRGRLYFWTLTPNGLGLSDWQFANAFKRFRHRLNKYVNYEFQGLRVFEAFESGYLHCHFVCNQRLGVVLIRRLVAGTGLGRVVHVRRAVRSDRFYLSKYLAKGFGLKCACRKWARIGDWEHCPVNRVVTEGGGVEMFRYALRVTKNFGAAQLLVARSRLTGDWSWFPLKCRQFPSVGFEVNSTSTAGG